MTDDQYNRQLHNITRSN